jgi:hypothetical protein
MNRSREELLSHFVGWTRQKITGENEAQTFVDRLIEGVGQPGTREVAGTCEHRVKKPPTPARHHPRRLRPEAACPRRDEELRDRPVPPR